jgi:hypothetical protein
VIRRRKPENGGMTYEVAKSTGGLGEFYGQGINSMVQELNIFHNGNVAKYLGTVEGNPRIHKFWVRN